MELGEEDIVEILLQNGAVVDSRNDHDWTPIHIASSEGNRCQSFFFLLELKYLKFMIGHAKIVKILILAGADIETRQNDDWTALHLAAERGFSCVDT